MEYTVDVAMNDRSTAGMVVISSAISWLRVQPRDASPPPSLYIYFSVRNLILFFWNFLGQRVSVGLVTNSIEPGCERNLFTPGEMMKRGTRGSTANSTSRLLLILLLKFFKISNWKLLKRR